MTNLTTSNSPQPKKALTFFDVLRFAAGYWIRQPIKLTVIMLLVLSAALFETYLPSALASFLSAIQGHSEPSLILNHLGIFVGVYVIQAILFGVAFLTYNSFETTIFKALIDDAFTHVQRLSEQFFVNTFAGSIISKITRARHQIEVFEDQVLVRIFPTLVIRRSSVFSAAFSVLALLMVVWFSILTSDPLLVLKVSYPAQGRRADAQDSYSAFSRLH